MSPFHPDFFGNVGMVYGKLDQAAGGSNAAEDPAIHSPMSSGGHWSWLKSRAAVVSRNSMPPPPPSLPIMPPSVIPSAARRHSRIPVTQVQAAYLVLQQEARCSIPQHETRSLERICSLVQQCGQCTRDQFSHTDYMAAHRRKPFSPGGSLCTVNRQ